MLLSIVFIRYGKKSNADAMECARCRPRYPCRILDRTLAVVAGLRLSYINRYQLTAFVTAPTFGWNHRATKIMIGSDSKISKLSLRPVLAFVECIHHRTQKSAPATVNRTGKYLRQSVFPGSSVFPWPMRAPSPIGQGRPYRRSHGPWETSPLLPQRRGVQRSPLILQAGE